MTGVDGEPWRSGLFDRLRPEPRPRARRSTVVRLNLDGESLAVLVTLAGVRQVSRSEVLRWALTAPDEERQQVMAAVRVMLGTRPEPVRHTRGGVGAARAGCVEAPVPA